MREVSKPFPLFRLPVVPLTKINRYMDLQEILLISLVSKKSAYIMRSLLPPNWFDLKLSFYSNYSEYIIKIVLRTKEPWDPVITKGRQLEKFYKLQVTEPSGDVSYQWAEPQLQDLVNITLTHFATVFNPTISISFKKVYSEEFVMGVMDHVKQLNLVKKSIKLPAVSMSPENYKRILDECKEVSKLWLYCEVTTDFEYHLKPDFRVDDLLISDGHWMHLEDFSNCKTVTVLNSSEHKQLTYANPEVPRALIRKWIESDCQLEYLEVRAYWVGIDYREVLTGLEHRPTEQTEHSHSVEITRRCDGKKATVKCEKFRFEFKVIG
ncbi:hypothetical protein CRE_04189 [Caenorhabditis remanei]|uniref:F-box domain-containing protein n=1 Tax=Caenorhabditis remanei TaxID=31234 RepID=E3MYX0_CAERE|nr:hypothetical protein CRE_04189 [Caenorhabditis remanei]